MSPAQLFCSGFIKVHKLLRKMLEKKVHLFSSRRKSLRKEKYLSDFRLPVVSYRQNFTQI